MYCVEFSLEFDQNNARPPATRNGVHLARPITTHHVKETMGNEQGGMDMDAMRANMPPGMMEKFMQSMGGSMASPGFGGDEARCLRL